MTLPEVLLWRHLRGAPNNVSFRRQHPIGAYVLDFYNARARLCIEIDGMAHDMGATSIRDLERDAWLRSQGIQVVRIPAAEVLRSPEGIAEAVVRHCLATVAAPPSAAEAADTSPFALRENREDQA